MIKNHLSLKSPIVVVGDSLHQVHLCSWDAAYGPVPVVSYPHVKVSGVKVLKVLVEGHKVLNGEECRITFKMEELELAEHEGI